MNDVEKSGIEIQAPAWPAKPLPHIFLAGGITDCPDWQREVADSLVGRGSQRQACVVLNPRRPNFPIGNPQAAYEQITWEHHCLRRSDIVLFWFPCETLCPIALYELGAMSMTQKPIMVGCHPEYKRKEDVVIQTKLVRPDVRVQDSIEHLLGATNHFLNEMVLRDGQWRPRVTPV